MSNERPILTIGIPTFNRGWILDKSLNWILKEVGNDSRFEVLISDNASTDNTEEIVRKYQDLYTNLVYHKQHMNLEFDKNLKTVFNLATGEFIKVQSDDDYFNFGDMNYILDVVSSNSDADVFSIDFSKIEPTQYRGEGYGDYFKHTSLHTNIGAMILLAIKKDAYNKIDNKDRYLDSGLYQVYVQMELLKNNPKFCIYSGLSLVAPTGEGRWRNLNLGDMSIANYFDILSDYNIYGLDDTVIKDEKRHYLFNCILPVLYREISIRENGMIEINVDTVEEMYIKYFYKEEYFEEKLIEIRAILNAIKDATLKS